MDSLSSLISSIESKLSVEIEEVRPVGGGCISSAAVLSAGKSGCFFLKWNKQAPCGFFIAEARGLEELRRTNAIRVPEVFVARDSVEGCPAFVLMEALEPGDRTDSMERELGRSLADLHACTADRFGFESDNFIGIAEQINRWENDWSEFFFEHRLLWQLKLGQESGWFDYRFEKLFERVEADIRSILSSCEAVPSLLHGDLWQGNVFWSKKGPVLIDPAVYYGSSEADIAFSELFGGFGKSFYDAYGDAIPKREGYRRRKSVLNLYHLMNHANIFGGSYVKSVYGVLRSI